jgi:hypothetical protein
MPGFLTNEYYVPMVGPREQEIDFVGRYENLADDLVTALRLAGEDFNERELRSTPPVNRGDYGRFAAEYDRDLLLALISAEEESFVRFGYSASLGDLAR